MTSVCCGAPPWLGNWHSDGDIHYGICDACREHCEFELEEEEDEE